MRSNTVILVAGARGVGKTDFVKEEIVIPSVHEKKLIIDMFDSPPWRNMKTFAHPLNSEYVIPILEPEAIGRWKQGLYRCFSSDIDSVFNEIETSLINALIVHEDSTKYIGHSLSKSMRKYIYDSKQKNLDLVFIFHSLASIPPELVRAADILVLFKTNEGAPSKQKYPFPEIPKAMEHLKNSKNHFENVTIQLN